MSVNVDILVTDFQKVRSSLSSTINNNRKANGFIIVNGDYDKMNRTKPTEDSVYGMTNAIANIYCKDRYFHIVTISLYNKSDNFIELDLIRFNEIMDRIDDIYTREEIPVLFINTIAREIYLNCTNLSEEITDIDRERYGQEAADLLKKYGYIDIGSDYRGEFSIPEFLLIRVNDIGSAMIDNNFKSFW